MIIQCAVNLFYNGHTTLKTMKEQIDRPIAGLLADLKRLRMLDDTLVIWGGEFGRTPMVQNNPQANHVLGRDHRREEGRRESCDGGD